MVRVLAAHRLSTGDHPAALALHEELVQLAPEDPYAWNNLAVVLASLDTERALKAALKASELAPDDATILDTLGWTFTQLGELDKGLANLREAAARNGRSPSIRYHLAVALQEYGNTSAARRELEQALGMSENFPEREDATRRLDALRALR